MHNYDLHRHLGGSLSPETVWELIKNDSTMSNLAESLDDLYRMMTYKDDTKYNFHHFLKKFTVQNHIRWTEDAIDRACNQVIADMKDLWYCELRFSIDKYLNYIPWDEHEACLFVLDRISYWSSVHDVKIGPVLSIKYESAWVAQKRLSKLINHWRIAEQLVGIDMVGNEAMFDRKRLKDVYRYWRMCGKGLLAHAGESQGPNNIKMAIEDLGVSRVSHGIRIVEDQELIKLAKDKKIVFDVAISSNIMTGVVKDINCHPLKKMHEEGLLITIGTDDPVTFCTTMDNEYQLVAKILNTNVDSDIVTNIKKNSQLYALKRSQK